MKRLAAILAFLVVALPAAAIDHSYKAWDDLLKKHVRYVQNGNASRVDYAGFARDPAQLKAVLDDWQKVTRAEFDGWTKPQQQAFLMNAYNAFTIEKILRRYPDIKSIRDYGTVFGNPWKDKFFTLFGQPAYLDFIEHETLRKDGVYDDPRVHVSVVCASIGCPMLRNEAFVAVDMKAVAPVPKPVTLAAARATATTRRRRNSRCRRSSTGTGRTSRRATRVSPR